MLTRRSFLSRRRSDGARLARLAADRLRPRRRPSGASSSSSSAAPPTGWHRRPDRRSGTSPALRGDFAQDFAGGAKLGPFFTLHPALAETAKMYADTQALFVHAVASPYRDRSHFDGQNVLETGGSAAYRLKDGWMNRLLGLVPAARWPRRSRCRRPCRWRFAAATKSPPTRHRSWPSPSDDLLARVGALYEADQQLHGLWTAAMETRMQAGDADAGRRRPEGRRDRRARGQDAARRDGARIAMIETNGWDTHSGQRGRLTAQLRDLDQLLAALKTGLGAEWANTAVLVATEFGRTVRPNGTGGTDHGQASAAMLLGGAVAGGKVIADWPGLPNGASTKAAISSRRPTSTP